jgi:hypothetical protein
VAEYACRNYGNFRDFRWATGGTVFASRDYDDVAALHQVQPEDFRWQQSENFRWEQFEDLRRE